MRASMLCCIKKKKNYFLLYGIGFCDICTTHYYYFYCCVRCTRVELRLIVLRRPRTPSANRTAAAIHGLASGGIDTYVAPVHPRPRDRGVWSMVGSKATAFAALYTLCSTGIHTRSFACVLFVWWPTIGSARSTADYFVINRYELPRRKRCGGV